ncbi:hypothetical protein [Bacteroides thetaiotaomicron]|uniref:hypothetical protein n=1 Tax=Bacteroides thetaiotaomicron TaxID=818 RepID=UPI001E61BF2B|nr:hypothetical protein [Bacteroides thetaiotaomicron]MDC2233981.1 hypothetical protein [Bacteroides thetaiotaomicron]MDT4420943.1 hypothetical protein [Bacteroides thetaiotaomicron]
MKIVPHFHPSQSTNSQAIRAEVFTNIHLSGLGNSAKAIHANASVRMKHTLEKEGVKFGVKSPNKSQYLK